jgi:hypothetical protein
MRRGDAAEFSDRCIAGKFGTVFFGSAANELTIEH